MAAETAIEAAGSGLSCSRILGTQNEPGHPDSRAIPLNVGVN
ncbi:hypothetical protein GBP346_A0129 [Burkholderia pseudomallei MSHR346]|nr:hypothetical protein GBP346_A0129 [Burkholderia pseudomallei MSHR346]